MFQLQTKSNGQWYVNDDYPTHADANTARTAKVVAANANWSNPPTMRIKNLDTGATS